MTDMVAFFSALELALRDFNQPVESGQAIAAALRSYAESSAQPARTGARTTTRTEPVGSRR
jgi:hypothetical protein